MAVIEPRARHAAEDPGTGFCHGLRHGFWTGVDVAVGAVLGEALIGWSPPPRWSVTRDEREGAAAVGMGTDVRR